MIQAVLFDMDGVLLDTERFGQDLLPEIAARYGYSFTDEHYFKTLGITNELGGQLLLADFGPDYPHDAIMEEYHQSFVTHAQAGTLPLKPGAPESLRQLRAMGLRLALATSADREIVDAYLEAIPALHGAFDAVVCGTDVQSGKPAPDIYLTAAKKLGLSPAQCIGVEDSVNGLKSLFAAGIPAVMIPDLIPYDEGLAGLVTWRLDSLFELMPLLTGLRQEPTENYQQVWTPAARDLGGS